MVDSGVYASAFADQMLAGKQYYQAVRVLTIVYEVMMQALIVKFLKWVEYVVKNCIGNMAKTA